MLIDPSHLALRHVLVIGDVMLDRYLKGRVTRISPEAPVPILSQSDTSIRLGGAANVAIGVSALGVKSELIGLAGMDANGKKLFQLLQDAGIGTSGLVRDPSRCTTIKTRIVAGHQQIARIDEECAFEPTPAIQDEILRAASAAVESCDAVVISDYAKGVCTDRIIQSVIAMARAHAKPVIVDPKRKDFAIYRGATVITPNLRELQEAIGFLANNDDLVLHAGRELQRHTDSNILVTRSEAGMTLFQDRCEPEHLPAKALEVADVSGAGDTVVATLATMLADRVPLLQAVSFANTAAGIAVSKHGTYVVSLDELLSAVRKELTPLEIPASVLELDRTLNLCRKWRHDGLSVGLANGCFDIIHPGHIRLIGEAASQCDRLIVAINSDSSVRILKGPTRPINDEQSRATVIAAIKGVAAVTIFDDETPIKLVQTLLPDILIKGGDYTVETIIGAPDVLAAGGRVHIVPTVAGHSTTAITSRTTGEIT